MMSKIKFLISLAMVLAVGTVQTRVERKQVQGYGDYYTITFSKENNWCKINAHGDVKDPKYSCSDGSSNSTAKKQYDALYCEWCKGTNKLCPHCN